RIAPTLPRDPPPEPKPKPRPKPRRRGGRGWRGGFWDPFPPRVNGRIANDGAQPQRACERVPRGPRTPSPSRASPPPRHKADASDTVQEMESIAELLERRARDDAAKAFCVFGDFTLSFGDLHD